MKSLKHKKTKADLKFLKIFCDAEGNISLCIKNLSKFKEGNLRENLFQCYQQISSSWLIQQSEHELKFLKGF